MHPHLVFPVAFAVLSASLTAAPQSPAADEVLTVERRSEIPARNRLARELDKIFVRILAEDMEPANLCRYLASATEDKVNFIVALRDGEELAPLTLDLPRMRMMRLMSIVQQVSDMRFVYRDGMVLVTHKDEVKPVLYTQVYDLRSATMPLKNTKSPVLGVRVPGEDQFFPPEEEESSTTVSGFTMDDIEDLLRNFVTPDSWDVDGVAMSNTAGVLTVRHSAQGQRQVKEALVRMGVLPSLVLLRARPVTPRRR